MIRKILMACVWALMGVGVSHAEDITIQFNGSTAKVKQQVKDSVNVTVEGAHVSVESAFQAHKLTIALSGQSDDGQLILKTNGKAKLQLKNLQLTSQEGAPFWLKNKKKVEIVAEGANNTLTIMACNDTANHKAATIWAKDKLLFSGKGKLNVVATGDGCRGIKSKDDITIEELTLNVTTSGNHLGEKPFSMGGFPGMPEGGFPDFGGMRPEGNDSTRRGGFGGFLMGGPGGFDFNNLPDSVRQNMEEMRKNFEEMMQNGNFPMGGFPGGFGGRPEGNDSTRRGGFPGFGGGGMPDFGGGFGNPDNEDGEGGGMGFGGKRKYVASTKGIASKGKIIVNSGNVTVRTNTAGAEGIEGKEGVILNGGNVDVLSPDDAINANATIEFNGANVIARSKGNDAVDSNPKGGFFMPFGGNNEQNNDDPAIIIRGGTVYAWSQVGSPEEGLDCDFAALVIEGGTVFSVGGGMGEMPSVPTNQTAKQATALMIGLSVTKDEPIQIYDSNSKLIDTITVPFTMRPSASLVTSPAFKVGNSYTIKTKDYEKTFTLNENFTTVR